MKRISLATSAAVLSLSVAAACGNGSTNNGPAAYEGPGDASASSSSGSSSGGSPASSSGISGSSGGSSGSSSGGMPPPPPTTATYVRGSLTPVYGLIPRSQYGLNDPPVQGADVALQDSDLEATGQNLNGAVSALQKEQDVEGLISSDNGTPVTIIANGDDQQRANLMPFRGKPSDVKVVSVDGTTQLFVPLGGDVMTVGDQVSILTLANGAVSAPNLLTVGVRPQRLAVHPANLVFVCNQYSNYISIIDPRTDALLLDGSKPVEIPTEYMCSDLAFVPAPDNNPDHQFLYVANRWRHSVLKYEAFVVRDASNNPVDVIQPDNQSPSPANKPITEILGVGNNPFRLALSDQQDILFVANNKGGQVARIALATDTVAGLITIGAPSADIVNIDNLLFVPTTTPARGLLTNQGAAGQVPGQMAGSPVTVTGLDNQPHVANPGALFDTTNSYNFEDVRNGLQQVDFTLDPSSSNNFYYTDDVSAESNFQAQQKVLAGSLATAVARNTAGTVIWLADSGSDLVEELAVNVASVPAAVTSTGRTFRTQHRPFAITFVSSLGSQGTLFVADAGSELVELIDVASGNTIATADTGFADIGAATYPASNVEIGELDFYSTAWSNNGRKACATCHFDELDTDGVGFSQGAIAPTTLAQVKPNHNLGTTGSYFWNGSFSNGNYTSLAFAFQTRDNCQIVEFGFVEGAGSDPTARVGDPNNRFNGVNAGQDDTQCRPVDGTLGSAANAAQITAVDQAEQKFAQAQIQNITGLQFEELARVIDAYSVYALRLPPNPLHQEYVASQGTIKQLDSQTMSDIQAGATLFTGAAGCTTCHVADDTYTSAHPFTDDLNHGSGAAWIQQFIETYSGTNDPRVVAALGTDTFPEPILDALSSSVDDHEVNTWTKLDYFLFACFDVNNCIEFDDPLAVRGDETEETRRLNLILDINLADPDRQFIPGDVVGQAAVNTPSLRGVWTQYNLLHHGLGHSVREAILAPGHPALQPGENGFAIDQFGHENVHGNTTTLTAAQVQSLVTYVDSIQ